jgi:hypothetical protein
VGTPTTQQQYRQEYGGDRENPVPTEHRTLLSNDSHPQPKAVWLRICQDENVQRLDCKRAVKRRPEFSVRRKSWGNRMQAYPPDEPENDELETMNLE